MAPLYLLSALSFDFQLRVNDNYKCKYISKQIRGIVSFQASIPLKRISAQIDMYAIANLNIHMLQLSHTHAYLYVYMHKPNHR